LSWLDPGFPQEDSHPVVCVRWNEAQDYATWLSTKTSHHYRLLTEAEYEYLNRAGTSTAYFWGDRQDAQCIYANAADAAAKARFGWTTGTASCNDGYAATSPVGQFQPNRFGLYDTSGNVRSWTQDCWHDNYDGAPLDGSPWMTDGDCSRRVLRGGSWNNSMPRSGFRGGGHLLSSMGNNSSGLRVARTE
jgi:formylglycine-generating enzyme required for sulfatase activity